MTPRLNSTTNMQLDRYLKLFKQQNVYKLTIKNRN